MAQDVGTRGDGGKRNFVSLITIVVVVVSIVEEVSEHFHSMNT